MNSREDQSHLHPSEVQQRPVLLLLEEKVPDHGSHLAPWHNNWSKLWYNLIQSVGWVLSGTSLALGAQWVPLSPQVPHTIQKL